MPDRDPVCNVDQHPSNDIETTLELRIQCDRVEDDVARPVQFVAERSSR